MRLIVTGTQGQVVRALQERGPAQGVEIVAVGRPEFDLADPASVARALGGVEGDAIINAAAYTAVDKAETEEELATRINGAGAGAVARFAAARGLPLLHISTDYVFDGALDRPWREDDSTGPIGAYGRSKLAGEQAVAAADPRATILRTAWVYAPFGANFVRTMLRLGETREEVSVVADQRGAPTAALDIADALIAIARRRLAEPTNPAFSGIFHMSGSGEASWADFAEEIFAEAERHGRKPVRVRRIATADYPTPARRPANSRLDNSKLAKVFGVALPDWRLSARACVARLLQNPL
ncbi:dTDP-4-dehydrorhamnose reductase [Rhodoblastus acidophilus]|uniref:dTDP-4-dehydrorhamnose reductase n=1 Tax=Candidatus Rhodoblastus alkanivorans TaxID=2954117 RepID=A0ABS9Z3U7_9HYPH|nr:dTDP-4-dehydrorhamnose reductase [Candidatus Rhodoblastus alkanivorans]MCI4679962.1 dTDP-4-dehydrorhamnose reductase [Candidatus Rhodoblastus alkanivorans]MCI4682345.1 dTDP-4-dehydrorhamnose reductase [Candidatus Rhodoblastus alkanivorans]MDI4639648.1 dTDP-4-dehydrorhamnose reductase [Rhodoblastus acidophilus]